MNFCHCDLIKVFDIFESEWGLVCKHFKLLLIEGPTRPTWWWYDDDDDDDDDGDDHDD